MKSPFPGMDPYMEHYWGDFHTSFAVYASDHLNPLLPADLVSRIEEWTPAKPARGEPMTQRSIGIIDLHRGNQLVTAIELVGPQNKISDDGRATYQRRRTELLKAGASLVEVDLNRSGRPNLAIPESRLPASPYRICVVNACEPVTALCWPVSLRTRLPVISIPLRKTEKEVPLDFQVLVDMVYERGRYHRRDYSERTVPPLSEHDDAWADQLLRDKGLR